jgi:cytochrome P450
VYVISFGETRQPHFEPEQDDRLWVSDPKAIQYILQTARYNIVKPYAARFALNAATGRGVNGAEGNHRYQPFDEPASNGASIGPDHHRQRRIILPAFGSSESRAQIPVFRQCAHEVKTPLFSPNHGV